MIRSVLKLAVIAAVLIVLLCKSAVAYNDHFFPPAPAATSAIDFDSHGFLINGKRTFIVSGGMEYARVPRALWRDRLLRFKRAGFNCVETYVFWNYHEPREGEFDFSGDHDLDAYLKLIHQLGMYAIVRVGPYCCAEWDSGGFPVWLRFVPGLEVRVDNKPFETYVGKFFDKLIPIVSANQINHGGSVILVQLENEYPLGWTHNPSEGYGTNIPNGYFQFLHDKAVALGIQVPYFFSGMHHGSAPGEFNGGQPLDDPTRPNPWITTEFWTVWYSSYGQPANDDSDYGNAAATYGRRTWRIIANGGNGYNYYMAHGGTNFAYSNDDEDAASYDYGAPVGQAGDLRPSYYAFKRAALFARSFEDILENSSSMPNYTNGLTTTPSVNVITRSGPSGTIQFLDNPLKQPVTTTVSSPADASFQDSTTLTLAPGEIIPVVSNFEISPGFNLNWSPTRILGIAKQGSTTTIVAYGPIGSTADLHFSTGGLDFFNGTNSPLKPDSANDLQLKTLFVDGPPQTFSFGEGTNKVQILLVSDSLADRTWFVDSGSDTYIILGPKYVGDVSRVGNKITLNTEEPWNGSEIDGYSATIYGPNGIQNLSAPSATNELEATSITLGKWQVKPAILHPFAEGPAWLASTDPLQMGADGDITAEAWYQTKVNLPQAGTYIVDFTTAADRLTVYVDGVKAAQDQAPKNSLVFTASAGPHTLLILTAHDGRPKFFPWLGPIFSKYSKGLLGPATLSGLVSAPNEVTNWRVLKLPGDPGDTVTPPDSDSPNWQSYNQGDNIFNASPGFAWFETNVTVDGTNGNRATLYCDSIDNNGRVFVNSVQLPGRHGVNEPFDIPLNSGANRVDVLVENQYDQGGISPLTLVTRSGEPTPVTGWLMHGGPGDPLSTVGYKPLDTTNPIGGPAFFRTTFISGAPITAGPQPMWRIITNGLGHGSIWVNGHNLGRYPERIAVSGLYVPECWLVTGVNTLVIYDEDGRLPTQVTISAEIAASRTIIRLSSSH